MWERLKSSAVLTMRRGCDSPWVRSGNLWAECSSPWKHSTWVFSWSWSAFTFLSSSSWRHYISMMRVWSCCTLSVSIIDTRWGWESSRGVSREAKPNANHGWTRESWQETTGYVLPWPHGGNQMLLPKFRASTRQGGRGRSGLLDFSHRLWEVPLSRWQETRPVKQRTLTL